MTENEQPSEAPWLIYTLHFDPPLGRVRHYTGITKANRLAKRLQEHASGRGARLTARAIDHGCVILLGHTQPCSDPNDEKRIKKRGNASARCAFCKPQLEIFRDLCVVSAPNSLPAVAAPVFLNFPSPAPQPKRE